MGLLEKLSQAQQLLENIAQATASGKFLSAASSLRVLEEALSNPLCEREEEVCCVAWNFLKHFSVAKSLGTAYSEIFPDRILVHADLSTITKFVVPTVCAPFFFFMKYCISKMAVFSLVVHFSFIFCCAVEFFLYLYVFV